MKSASDQRCERCNERTMKGVNDEMIILCHAVPTLFRIATITKFIPQLMRRNERENAVNGSKSKSFDPFPKTGRLCTDSITDVYNEGCEQ